MDYNTIIKLIMRLNDKIKAIKLRKKGKSYSFIKQTLKVSKSTLSEWLKNIELNKKQQEKLLKGLEISRYAAAKAKRDKRIEQTKEIIKIGEKEFPFLINKPLFLIGLSLYWAEGDKNELERVKFTNSDPRMITFMMKWFKEICEVPQEKFRIALHIHNLHSRKNVVKYWSEITRIPKKQFHKLYIKPTALKYRRNILYNGTCAIIVNDKKLFRKIVGWKLGLLNYYNTSP